MLITQEIVKSLMEYNPETGVCTWRERGVPSFDAKFAGGRAGTIQTDKYGKKRRQVSVKGKLYKEHRVIWLYMTGHMPDDEIDHINHDATDNRWENLREATRHENAKNLSMSSLNTSGFPGVRWEEKRGKWYARIRVNKAERSLGRFDDLENAKQAVIDARKDAGYHENHGSA